MAPLNKKVIQNIVVKDIKKPLQITTTVKGEKELIALTLDLLVKVKPQFDGNKCQSRPPYESIVELCYEKADLEGSWSWEVDRDWKKDSKSKSLLEIRRAQKIS
jgi:hypothetical protein